MVITIQSDSSEGSISVNGDEKLSLVGDTNDTISTTITMQLGDTTTFYSNMDYMIIPYKDGKGMAKDFNPASLTSYDASWDKIELQIYFSQT